MKEILVFVAASLALAAAPARAEDLTGRWGLGLDAGWGARLGSRAVRDSAGNGAALGGSLNYGLAPNWRASLNYENINLSGKRFEPITASATYLFFPEKRWTPTLELGLGGARASNIPDSSGRETSLAAKAALGVEYSLCEHFTAGLRAAFYNAGHTSTAIGHEVDALTLGGALTYWFGGRRAEVARAKPAPKPASQPAAAAPAPAPAAAPVTVTSLDGPIAGKVTISLDVQFDTDKTVVKPEYDAKIQKVANFLKSHPKATAEIEGHTDSMGAKAYNDSLSQRRAESVRSYMIEKCGVDGSRLKAKGYGWAKPIGDNKTAAGRQQNRRVVATIDAQN